MSTLHIVNSRPFKRVNPCEMVLPALWHLCNYGFQMHIGWHAGRDVRDILIGCAIISRRFSMGTITDCEDPFDSQKSMRCEKASAKGRNSW